MVSVEKEYAALSSGWRPDSRAAMVDYLSSEAKREVIKGAYKTAADLAAALDPTYVVTPALRLIAENIETVLTQPRHNLLVTTPPQEGKSTLCSVYAPLRALMLNPACRIILATHGDSLAAEHSMMCQKLIREHGSGVIDPVTTVAVEDKLGFKLTVGAAQVKAWKIAGGRGGMLAVGWGSSVIGRAADLLILDDLYKNQMEADSENYRRKIAEWFSSVARTRLSPNASIILIMSRWHPDDLAGSILTKELDVGSRFRTWRHINIPAIAEAGVNDSLGRPPGEVMESARGRDRAEFEQTRRDVGERVWYAMFQGVPKPPAGGLFLRQWFDPPADMPHDPVATIIGVDPAEGEGDACGIVAAALNAAGEVVFTEDWSAVLTSDQWAARAVTLALQTGAREVAMESYVGAITYTGVLKRAYEMIHVDAVVKHRAGVELSTIELRALGEQPPFTIYRWRAPGRVDSVGRAALLRQALETRRARVVMPKMAALVDDCCGWQIGQHQPDRVAAAIIAHDRLAALAGGRMTVATPVDKRPDPITRLRNISGAASPLARRLGG